MRCRNCGWDNPGGNVKCEKCNAPLNDAIMEDSTPQYGYVPDDFSPRATVASYDSTNAVNPRATITGCASCGYPVRPDDTECPVCGSPLTGGSKDAGLEITANSTPKSAGTIIQGSAHEDGKGKADAHRKKLTGFLVTFSSASNGRFFPLYEGKNYVGRDATANVCIQDDSSVSEKHLSILYRTVDRKFKFKDEQSSNGTFINDELTDEGELKNNDMIRIGSTRLLFMEIPLTLFE